MELAMEDDEQAAVTLTPEAETFIKTLYGSKPISQVGVSVARTATEEACRRFGGRQLPVSRVEDIDITTIDQPDRTFVIRVYYPSTLDKGSTLPCLLYAHGGGFMRGSIEFSDNLCRRIMNESTVPLAIVSVNYRLAPGRDITACLSLLVFTFSWSCHISTLFMADV